MRRRLAFLSVALVLLVLAAPAIPSQEKQADLLLGPINVKPPHVSTDPTVKWDYDIVYVRARARATMSAPTGRRFPTRCSWMPAPT